MPHTAGILVSLGDSVMPDSVIAKSERLPGILWRVDVASVLKVGAKQVASRLIVKVGDIVAAGDILAVGGTFFSRRIVRSPVAGTVALVSRSRGLLYVREYVETSSEEEYTEVPVTEILGVKPLALMVCKDQNVNLGDHVVKGQVLARHGRKTVTCPVYGTIKAISATKGTVTIRPLFRPQIVRAYIKGTVTGCVHEAGVEITGEAIVINGLWGVGGESSGVIHLIHDALTKDLNVPAGSVVVSPYTATPEGLARASELGVRGVILGWLSSGIAMSFAGALGNMGVTGDEDVPYPLILMRGFLPPGDEVYEQGPLERLAGRLCSLRGTTHIRAGVVRPEILVYGG